MPRDSHPRLAQPDLGPATQKQNTADGPQMPAPITAILKAAPPIKKARTKYAGRTAGTPNKFTGTVKDMVQQALEEAGGVKYLVRCAKKNPTAFLTLVNKMMPTALEANVKSAITYILTTGVPDEE